MKRYGDLSGKHCCRILAWFLCCASVWAIGCSADAPGVYAFEEGAVRKTYFSPEMYGAKGDGATDDTAAFQKALDEAGKKGGVVLAEAGTYLFRGNLRIPQAVTLKGVWENPHHSDIGKGTVFLVTAGRGKEDGEPFITLSQSSGLKGVTIFYPEQKFEDIVPYPWCIRAVPPKMDPTSDNEMHMCLNPSVENVTLVNPYKALDFGAYHNELHVIRNVYGQPLKVGLYIDKVTDIGRVENVHFNPHFWARADFPGVPRESTGDAKKLFAYLRENLTGFLIGRTDWQYMRDCFVIFPKVGFHFVQTRDRLGGLPNVAMTQCGADITSLSVLVEASQGHAGLAFSNCQFMGTAMIRESNRGPVKFTNCGFWYVPETQEQVVVDGKGTVTLNSCHFAGWDRQNKGAACIRIDGGAALIHACDFLREDGVQVEIGKGAKAVSIVGCRLRGGQRIENNSATADVQIGLNITQ